MHSDAGNAIVEFIVAGVGLQLALLALVTSLATHIDAQAAADLMSRQTLRAKQLGLSQVDAKAQIDELAKTFGLASSDYSIAISGHCAGPIVITARVRQANATARAKCH